jgi:hypothetical protein
MANGVQVHYSEVYEACHRALWHLGKASDLWSRQRSLR